MASRILIVDDESSVRQVLLRALGGEGYEVIAAANGLEAIQSAKGQAPDLVLLDVLMPQLNGLDACRRLRSDVRTRRIPVMLITARGSLEDRLKGFQAGADDYMIKPFDLDELKARVACSLGRSRRDLWTHPLTQLPGSPGIEENVRGRLASRETFAFAYIDVDFFKAYNDAYGYEAGDHVIRTLADLLIAEAVREDAELCFPGHVGGDDFVFIGPIESLQRALPRAVALFDEARARFYKAADWQAGRIRVQGRMRREQEFPLMSLTAAVVKAEQDQVSHYACLVERASELKRYVKSIDHQGKSLVFWDRRRYDTLPAPMEPGS